MISINMDNINNLILKTNGYKLIYLPEHSSAMSSGCWKGYVYEHIAIAEELLGRKLKEDEIVHHMDCNRSNNRHENLLVLNRSQHMKLHLWINAGMPMVGTNTENSSFVLGEDCMVCGRTLQGKQKGCCSPSCFNIKSRKVERPSKAQLLEDINSMSLLSVGRKYSVSDNAIRKWMKSYGIKKNEKVLDNTDNT